MTRIDPLAIHLDHGSHGNPDEGMCVMEAVAFFAGEPFTDRPKCVSPILTSFAISLNDQWSDEQRQKLRPFIPRLPGTAGDRQDEARSYLALDWLIRTYTPTWLDLAGLSVEAQELRGLRRIVDMAAAEAAGPVVRAAQGKSAAARAAAGDAAGVAARAAARAAAWDAAGAAAWDAAGVAARAAARAAARDAAGAAAGAAARAAAGDAAGDAAGAAARDAAWDAARDAARAALRPTIETLQASALDLFDRMINPAVSS